MFRFVRRGHGAPIGACEAAGARASRCTLLHPDAKLLRQLDGSKSRPDQPPLAEERARHEGARHPMRWAAGDLDLVSGGDVTLAQDPQVRARTAGGPRTV
jgi:hypothetical protein